MFGFQRIGDLMWVAADLRARGFLLGGTAGRTTLSGEGLQHEDGHSHIMASTVPTVQAFDPAYAFELAVIIQDGIRRMFEAGEDIFYYITLYNENYAQLPQCRRRRRRASCAALYRFRTASERTRRARPVARQRRDPAQSDQAAGNFSSKDSTSAADVWSVTSYTELWIATARKSSVPTLAHAAPGRRPRWCGAATAQRLKDAPWRAGRRL